ncbi:MAG: alanine--tRNA ligase [Patescibacteria group bacterium]|nr:alanine--tRNA ligase [Patescibacteria group bacterium]MDD5490505.1 alanine--tRNA ligase [Patescibacteria group bacterium]
MTTDELRKKYLKFFEEKGHKVIPSASLIPENDPTVLFTTAGMHPLVPFLLGEEHPAGKRLVNVQKCVRTGDIDEVGDDWHLTFFEMLGNWSLGDYFKKEAIEMSWEFLTAKKWLGLDKDKIAVSVFVGDEDVVFDKEAYDIWKSLGLSEERIARLGKKDNWWGPAGKTGPCGPDTEMFYWVGEGEPHGNPGENPNDWVEIWNDVFMQYNKTADGKYEELKQKNIDTGMGLERTVAILNDKKSVYEIDEFKEIFNEIRRLSGVDYDNHNAIVKSKSKTQPLVWGNDGVHNSTEIVRSFRIVADHVRAATFLLSDERGIEPSNLGQGYVLRRLIRRTVRYGKQIGIEEFFTSKVAEVVINQMKDIYSELEKNKKRILHELQKEEEKFAKTLEKGLKEFKKLEKISGKDAFNLFSTYGFPLELTKELAREKGLKIEEAEFNEEFKKHQELSRTASVGQFKGGLADASEQVKKLHTATHLLHAALRQVLGDHVEQRGSNITEERLRFDFVHPQKMTPQEIMEVENLVNEQIKKKLPINCDIKTVEEAKKEGAIGLFEYKYGDKVKVYTVGDNSSVCSEPPFSREICGGPHVSNTGELGHFKIIKEEASSAGIRRIKAILE